MKKLENLRLLFINKLNSMIEGWEEKSIAEKAVGNDFEYTKALISINVADIYKKMFDVALKNMKYQDSFYQTYLGLLEKITTPWKEKMMKDKEFGMDEDYIKGETKILIYKEIISVFKECYNEVFGGTSCE